MKPKCPICNRRHRRVWTRKCGKAAKVVHDVVCNTGVANKHAHPGCPLYKLHVQMAATNIELTLGRAA